MEPRQFDRPRAYTQFTRRLVRLMMRGGRIVEGNIHVTEGQSLTVFLQTRRQLASLTEARWVGPNMQVLPHMAFRIDKIMWAGSLDEALPIVANVRQTGQSRWAELTLEEGIVMNVALHLGSEQRLTDYFDAPPPFLPTLQATIAGSDRLLGPVAVNTNAILAIREIERADDR